MSGEVAYLDTSAAVKLIVREPETSALRTELAKWSRRMSSALLRVELIRTAKRVGLPAVIEVANARVDDLDLIRIDDALLNNAAHLGPDTLRSLDAIHLATAVSLGSDLGAVITYDQRMSEGAIALGLPVLTPQ
jgi:uncharacterized protein